MSSLTKSSKTTGLFKAIAAPIILSSFFLMACSQDDPQDELDKLTSSMNNNAQKTQEILDKLENLSFKIQCIDKVLTAFEEGQISGPVTKQTVLDNNITIEVPDKKRAEALNSDHKVTGNKLDCSYVISETAPAP